jgi:type IV pilus assembly protein PilV
MKNERGFTLVEVLVATAILSIGILGVALMQTRAIGSNVTAMSRSNANAVALSFMEELKRLRFDDAMLADGAGALAGSAGLSDGAATPGIFPDLVGNVPDHSIQNAGFLGNFSGLGNTYRIVGAGNSTRLVDQSGREYVLFYNIDDDPWADGSSAFCVIRMFVYWQTPLGGVSHLELTTTKYNNT